MIFQTRRSTVYKGLHRVMVWRALICPSDFPCNVQVVACGGNGGNHQIPHPPLVVKEYIFPSAEAAGNLADLFRADGFHHQLRYLRQKLSVQFPYPKRIDFRTCGVSQREQNWR